MELEEWELLSENGDSAESDQEAHYLEPTWSFDADYFANSPRTDEQLILTWKQDVEETSPDVMQEVIAPPVAIAVGDVIFPVELDEEVMEEGKKYFDMLGVSPRSSFDHGADDEYFINGDQYLEEEMPNEYSYKGMDIFAAHCSKGFGSMWRSTGAGALYSVGVAAAMLSAFILGRNRSKLSKFN